MRMKLRYLITISSFVLLILVAVVFVGQCYTFVAFASEGLEDKILCTATIDDNFDESSFLIVLQSRYSRFRGVQQNVKEKLFQTEGICDVSSLTDFPSKYVIVDGELSSSAAPDLYEFYEDHSFKQILKATIEETNKQSVLDIIKKVECFDFVYSAEPNMIAQRQSVAANDSMYDEQWIMKPNCGIDVEGAWGITTGSKDVRVGVIDSGINAHEDLLDNLGAGWDFYHDDSVTNDDYGGHGTAVAGIIGAKGNNGKYMSGIAQNVTLVPLQTASAPIPNAIHYEEDRIEAIKYACALWENEDERIQILNHSIGGFGKSTALLSEICNFPGLFVWSAGNEGENVDRFSEISQFNLPNLISVGAINKNNERSAWSEFSSSNYGEAVNVYAPGGHMGYDSEKIITTKNITDKDYFYGTSAAAPCVSGVAALMLSANPNLTGAQLKSLILNNSDNITISTYHGAQNVKKLNAYKAVKAARDYYQTNVLTSNTVELAGVNGDTCAEFNIPASLNGKTVVSIGTNAFKNSTSLEKVVLPESVTNIKSGAFSGCTNLHTVVFENRNNIVTLGTNCFQNTASDLKLLVASDLYNDYRSSTGGQAYANKFVKTYLEGDQLYYEDIVSVPGEGYVTCDAYFYLPDKDPILLDQNVGRIGFDRYYIMVSLCGVEYPLGAIDDCRLAIEVGSGEDCFILTKEGTIAGYCPYEDGYLYVPYMQLYQKGITEFYIFAMQKYAQLMTFYPSDVTIQLIHKIYL